MQKGRCKHSNGHFHDTHCLAGVAYRDVVTDPDNNLGIAFRYPCTTWEGTKFFRDMTPLQRAEYDRRGTCEKYEEPTDGEIAEYEARVEAGHQQSMLALPLISKIKREHKGQSWKGVEECPVCKGKLHMTHSAYNGHVWGKCETDDCLAWME